MSRLSPVIVLLMVLNASAQEQDSLQTQDDCSEATRPHLSRCDQYFRCKVLAHGAHTWIAAQCQKGLVYMQNLGACVLPDSDWECDLSAEDEHDHSEENVYGIDNLNGAFATVRKKITAAPNQSRQKSHEASAQMTDSSLELNEIEASGDGSIEQFGETKLNAGKKPSTKSPSGILSQSQLDSFLAFYDAHSDLKSKTKPAPVNQQNHLQHLKEIIRQQYQLNRIGNQFKDTRFSWPKPVALNKQSAAATSAPNTVKDAAAVKIPPGMEDIIRSILQISQQAIANQKSSAVVAPTPEPVVKPIFIPISLNPIAAPTGSLAKLATAVNEQMAETKATTINSRPPVGPEVHGSIQADRNTLYNAFRERPINESSNYDHPPPVLFDAYGNRFVPKHAYQALRQSGPSYGHQSLTGVDQTEPQFGLPAASMFANSWGAAQQQQRHPEPLFYGQNQPSPLAPATGSMADPYGKLRDIIERIDQLSAIESNEQLESEDSDSESEASDAEPTSSGENSDENGPPGVSSSKLKRKLFTLGDATFDYEQYKDSMLPLVEANPNDDRISVVTCMVGSRQPNKTDCFRYYICNPHNGVFQSYTCPTFTAFNKHSRMCDMASYKPCKAKQTSPSTVRPMMKKRKGSSSPSDIGQLKSELRTAQRYVELIRAEAEKLRLHGSLQPPPAQKIIFLPSMDFSGASKAQLKPAQGKRKPARKGTTTTVAPVTQKTKPMSTVPRCRLEGRMPDPMNHTNYFVCHRKSPKKFIKLKMACPGSLIYCAASQYCTVPTNC